MIEVISFLVDGTWINLTDVNMHDVGTPPMNFQYTVSGLDEYGRLIKIDFNKISAYTTDQKGN